VVVSVHFLATLFVLLSMHSTNLASQLVWETTRITLGSKLLSLFLVPTVCSQSRLLEWHIVLIALGVVFLIAGGVFSAIILVCNCIRGEFCESVNYFACRTNDVLILRQNFTADKYRIFGNFKNGNGFAVNNPINFIWPHCPH